MTSQAAIGMADQGPILFGLMTCYSRSMCVWVTVWNSTPLIGFLWDRLDPEGDPLVRVDQAHDLSLPNHVPDVGAMVLVEVPERPGMVQTLRCTVDMQREFHARRLANDPLIASIEAQHGFASPNAEAEVAAHDQAGNVAAAQGIEPWEPGPELIARTQEEMRRGEARKAANAE